MNLKKMMLFTLILFIGISIISATDINDTTVAEQTQTDTLIESNVNEITSVQSDDIIKENNEQIETQTNTYTYTNQEININDSSYDGQTLILNDNVQVYSSNNQMINNITFTIAGNNVLIQNLNITNINQNNVVITVLNSSSNVNILNNNITTISNNTTNPVEVKAVKVIDSSSVVISGNNMNVEGVPQENYWINITSEQSNHVDTPFVDAVEVWNSEHVYVQNNNITVTNSTIPTIINSTAKAIVYNNNTRNSTIYNNKINMTGFDYIHAISLCYEIDSVTVSYNDINMNGTNYVGGLFGDYVTYSSIIGNNITGNCHNTSSNIVSNESMAFGINIFTEDLMGDIDSIGVTISYNNITLNSTIAYGIEDYYVESFFINHNNITIDANKAVGIAISMQESCDISSNNIQIHTQNDSNLRNVTEDIPPITSGIFCIASTDNDYAISNNIINITESASSDEIYTIRLHTTSFASVSGNYLGSSFVGGSLEANDSIYNDSDDSIIGVNYPLSSLNNINSGSISLKKNKLLKSSQDKVLKTSSQIITLNATTFDTYVTNHKFNDNVNDGDVIDIDGKLDGGKFSLNVNKAVNITSLKGNSYIACGQFIVNKTGSNSNISNLNFVNTFILVNNAQNVIIDNITSDNGALQRRGQLSIGHQSNNITLRNSYIHSWWNGGTSCLVLAGCTNCLIENNTVKGEGNVGNLFSLNMGADDAEATSIYTPTDYLCYHVNITIRNNFIEGPASSICYGLYLEGMNILVENNTVLHTGQAVDNYYGRSYNVTFINNYIPYGIFANRAISHQVLINNTLNEVYSVNDSIIINNTINKLYTANNNTVENNIIGSISISGNNTILNNKFDVVTIGGDNVLFDGNNVDSPNYNYSVKINSGNNITVTNNELSNNLTYGDGAVDGTADMIENNTGKRYIVLTNDNYSDYGFTGNANEIKINAKNNPNAYICIGENSPTVRLSISGVGIINLLNFNNTSIPRINVQVSTVNMINFNEPNLRVDGSRKGHVNLINSTVGEVRRDASLGEIYTISYTVDENSVILNKSRILTYTNTEGYLTEVPDSGTIIVTTFDSYDLFIDKSINMIPYNEGTINKSVTFLDGSEGSNITNIIFNEKVYVNTSNINFSNCTFNKGIIFNNASENILENCNITTNAASTIVSIKLDDENNEVITNADITVTLPDGKTVTGVTDENGTLIVPVDLALGENNIIVTYSGNETYNANNITVPIIVNTDNITETTTVNNTEGNNTITVSYDTVSITDAAIKFINSTNNQLVNNTVIGYTGVTLSFDNDSTNNNVKKNSLNATTKYNIDSVNGKENNIFEDNGILYDVNINLDMKTTFYAGELIPLNISVTNNFNNESVENGYVELWLIDGSIYENLTLTNGQASTYFKYDTVTGTRYDKYATLKAWYYPTDKYPEKQNTINFHTIESTGSIVINEINGSKVGENIIINTIINSSDIIDEGNISFEFADQKISVPVVNNTATLTTKISTAMMDNPTLHLEFESEKVMYNIKSNMTNLTIEAGITNIEVDEINAKINDEINITAKITDCYDENVNNGEIIFTNNQDEILTTAEIINGIATTTYTFTSEYEGKIIATINSTYYQTNNNENNLNIRKIKSIVKIIVPDTIAANTIINVTAQVLDEDGNSIAGAPIKLIIGQITYPEMVSNNNGTLTMPTVIQSEDPMNVTATYEGNEIYTTATSESIIKNRNTTTIIFNNITTNVDKETMITATITSEDNNPINEGQIIFTLENGTILAKIEVENSQANFTYTFPEKMETTITATYEKTYNYMNTTTTTILKVEPKPPVILKMDTTTFTIGESTQIKASIYQGDQLLNSINKGKVVFKVNGKTLKDSNGKIIYAKVINGTATIDNYIIPDSWNKTDITIEAVYSGSIQCDALRSNTEKIIIQEATPTITTNDITTTIGSTIELKATITDGSKEVNTGKVIFKINGKTVKDDNGKVIYLNVENGQVTTNYTITTTYKTKTYTLTAIYISSGTNRLEDTKTLSIKA